MTLVGARFNFGATLDTREPRDRHKDALSRAKTLLQSYFAAREHLRKGLIQGIMLPYLACPNGD
jgi:hypothetical protein